MWIEIVALFLLTNITSIFGLIFWYKESNKGPKAYRFSEWKIIDYDYHQKTLREKVRFSLLLLVPTICGFTHAAFSWLLPFVAEEVGTELAYYIEARRKGVAYEKLPETSYALSPWRWIWFVDGIEHVKFSGGSYCSHAGFAHWATG